MKKRLSFFFMLCCILAMPLATFATEPSVALDLPFTEGFDDQASFERWSIINANGDNKTWYYDDLGRVEYLYNSNEAANDWLISPMLNATGDITISLDYKVSNATYPEKFEVYIMDSPEDYANATLIQETITANNESFETLTIDAAIGSRQTVYIGIKCVSDADKFALHIDNFKVEAKPSTEPTALDLPFTEGFDDQASFERWEIIDANEDDKTWYYYKSKGQAEYSCHVTKAAEDWLISPMLNATGDITISLDYKGSSTTYLEKFEVYIMDSPDDYANATLIQETITANNESFETLTIDAAIGSRQTVYIGIKCVSDKNKMNLFIDNVKVEAIPVYTDLTYSTPVDGTVSITGYTTEPTGDIILPSTATIDGATYPITAIGNYAFPNCSELTSVIFANEYKLNSIGEYAFYNCQKLTTVEIPASVTEIGKSAFYNCKELTTVEIPASVTEIGENVFNNCQKLTTVEIPASVTEIGNYAFGYCNELTSVIFANESKLNSIGEYAFRDCQKLTTVEIPASVTEIGEKAFLFCDALEIVTVAWVDSNKIPEYSERMFTKQRILSVPTGSVDIYKNREDEWANFSYITDQNIDDITGITENGYKYIKYDIDSKTVADIYGYDSEIITSEVIIPATVEDNITVVKIGDNAFNSCTVINSVTIPDGVTEIGGYAFYGCNALESVEIPISVTKIGESAFHDCEKLASVSIPTSVTEIGESAFYGCKTLESVEIPISITEISKDAFRNCEKLASVSIPTSVTKIGESAFRICKALTSVSIPASVTEIGDYAFRYCGTLASVTLQTENPSIISSEWTFSDISDAAILYVPIGSKEAFEAENLDADWTGNFKGGIVEYTADKRATATENTADKPLKLNAETTPFLNLVIEEGAEVNAEGADLNILGSLIIEHTFEYNKKNDEYISNNAQWFSLGLPFAALADMDADNVIYNQVQKMNDKGEYVPAIAGVDYQTFSYNSINRAENGLTPDNWNLITATGDKLGEIIQFYETGKHQYRFIATTDVAKTALKTGRDGTYDYSDTPKDDSHNGWNVNPAGKTYTTAYGAPNGVSIKQSFVGTTGQFMTSLFTDAEAPGNIFAIQLTEPVAQNYSESNDETTEMVETYSFELVDANGITLDRIYLFDGSNKAQYRVGKMGAFAANLPQLSIKVDGKSYCTYSTLASEMDKSYNVAVTNATEASVVMKSAGNGMVTINGEAATVNSPIEVVNGEIVLKIGSTVTGVDDLTESVIITGGYNSISISGAEAGTAYAITTMTGVTTYGTVGSETTRIEKPSGVYVVKVNNNVTKVIVK